MNNQSTKTETEMSFVHADRVQSAKSPGESHCVVLGQDTLLSQCVKMAISQFNAWGNPMMDCHSMQEWAIAGNIPGCFMLQKLQ